MSKKLIQIIVPDRIKNPVGGIGVRAQNLMNALREEFDFDVIGFPEENPEISYTSVYNPFPHIQHGSLVTMLGQGAYLTASIEKRKPDLVHAYDWSVYPAAVHAAQHFNVPLIVDVNLSINLLSQSGIFYVHDPRSVDGGWIHQANCEMEFLGLRKAQKIIHVSEGYRNRFKDIENFSEKSEVVPNGIDVGEWEKAEKIKLSGEQKIKVVYIGRFTKMKGVEELCKAAIPGGIDLIFAGSEEGAEPHLYEMIMRKIKECPNVHYAGYLKGKEKIDTLYSADAIIMPSLHEPFGIVALEAFASRSILLSSFADGLADFVSNDTAINCGTTKESIEKAFDALISMPTEEKERRIQKNIELCTAYSWEMSAKKMKQAYNAFIL